MPRFGPRAYAIFAALASAAMLAAAHGFERIGGYEPCQLCLRQREVYWAALAAALAGQVLMARRPEVTRVVPALLGTLFLSGAVIAGFHAGIEWKFWPAPSGCGASGAADAAGLAGILQGERVRVVSCEDAAWTLFGLSMAGWNALVSLALGCLGLLTAARGSERRRELRAAHA